MKQVSKRILSFLMALCLLTSLVPAAFAADSELKSAADRDGFPYFWQEATVTGTSVDKTFTKPQDYKDGRNAYMAVKAEDTVRYVAADTEGGLAFEYWAPEVSSYQVALVQPVLDGGYAHITTSISGSGPYTLTYTATLKMSDQMAEVAAVNKDDSNMGNMKFVCYIADPYLATLDGSGSLDVRTSGIFQETGKRTKTDDGYAVEFELVDDWNDGTTENVKNKLKKEMEITASISVTYEELANVLNEGYLYTHGWIELTYGSSGENIPGFNDDNDGNGALSKVIVPANQYKLKVISPGSLEITVNDGQDPISGAQVTITWVNSVDGTEITREGNTNNNGKITFDNIPCGAYKVDVSYTDNQKNEYQKSVTYTVDNREAKLTVSLQKAAGGGILNTAVEGNQSASADNLEYAVDSSEVSSGQKVLIKLKVDEEQETNNQAVQMVNRYGTTEEKRGETVFTDFVDATLTKQVNNESPEAIKEAEGVIQIHIPLSQELMALIEKYDLNVYNTQVYRAHDVGGGTTLEQLTKSNSGADGTYYITSYGQDSMTQYYAVISTQKFSVYGFAIPIPTDSGHGGDGGGTSDTRYPVNTTENGSGTISSSHDKAAEGTRVTITVKPDEGYRLGSLTVTDKNGKKIAVTAKGDGIYTFIMPDSKVEVKANFVLAIATPEETGVADWLNTTDHTAYMVGYDSGIFGPDDNVTRGQVAQMFYRLLKNQNVTITATFQDVPADAWYAEAVHTLASIGIVAGVGNGRFEPDRAITRAEFSAIAVRFAKEAAEHPVSFQDVPESYWAYEYISTAAAYGWVTGVGNDLFAPYDNITRAQAAVIVNRMTGRLADQVAIDAGEGTRFPDVAKTHWAWYDIIEATTTHDYTKSNSTETWKD